MANVNADTISSILAQNPQLMNALQGRLGQLVGSSSGYIDSLPPSVKRRLAALEQLQAEHRTLERQFDRDVIELERKYESLYKPLYKKRAEIAHGDIEAPVPAVSDAEPQESPAGEQVADDVKGIPEFWLTVIKSSPVLDEIIFEADQDVLKHLKDIRCVLLAHNPGFRLEFEFDENDYFTDKVLVKTYYLDDTDSDSSVMFDRAEGCAITWKANKNLTVKTVTKKQRHKNTKQVRLVKKTVPNEETFFRFFSPPQAPDHDAANEHDDTENDNEDDDDEGEIGEAIQMDYELGEHFKDHLIPRAVDWFTGKAAAEFQEDDDDEEDYDEYDSEDEGEDDDEDDEDSEQGKRGAPIGSGSASAAAGTDPANQQQECKQQ